MEIISIGGEGMKNRLKRMIEKDGFYIILFICVCIVAITATIVTKGNIQEDKKDELSKGEDFLIVDEGSTEPSMEIAQMEDIIHEEYLRKRHTETIGQTEEIEEENKDKEEDLEYVADEEPEPLEDEYMLPPVDGKLGTAFTSNSLIYSHTLEEWTSHKGIDIFAQEGSEVRAALSGTIMEVYEDELWGIVIIMDHGEDLMTKYANLSTKDMVKEGQKIGRGEIISKVGKTASIEMMMEPHIHFEVIKDGINIDPMKASPAFSQLQ